MLRYLTLSDFVIVDRQELAFGDGFNVLTGETGAGKSILVDALKLLLGARADAGVVREGAARSEIAAEFSIDGDSPLTTWLDDNGFDRGEDAYLVRRVIDAGGRSRAFINGAAATLQQLAEAGAVLAEIHGQHEYQALLRRDAQRRLLDTFGAHEARLAAVEAAFREWHAVSERHRLWQSRQTQLADELADLTTRLAEVGPNPPHESEWEALQIEHKKLANAAELVAATAAVEQGLDSDAGLLAQLGKLNQSLVQLEQFDPALSETTDLLRSAQVQLQEAGYAIRRYGRNLEIDSERLTQCQSRIESLFNLARRYRTTPDQLAGLIAEWRRRQAELSAERDVERLAALEAAARARYDSAAEALSQERKKAAIKLGREVTAAMQELAMEGGAFSVALEALAEPAAHGIDQIEFTIMPHPGTPARPLARIASGGELARISLAIQVATSGSGSAATLVFDEVDAGIGGGVAERVGMMLREVSRARQVLCVTHLPQVAAQAQTHFRVEKTTRAKETLASVQQLDREQRIAEVARMLGGVKITATTRAHAREMLTNQTGALGA